MTTLASEAAEHLAVLDADSHITDVDDLWTKRAPAKYKDDILHVEQIDGRPTWVVEGRALGKAGGGSTIDKAGKKHPFQESMIEWDFARTNPRLRRTTRRRWSASGGCVGSSLLSAVNRPLR